MSSAVTDSGRAREPMPTAVVTGGGRGIGREIARRLGERGYAVLLTARDEAAGAAAARYAGPHAWSTSLDARRPDEHERVAAEASARGPLAVWVNNAGVLVTRKAWEHSHDDVALLLDTNVTGMIAGSLAAIRAMDRGHVINIASMSGLGPVPGLSVYAATKAAIVNFTLSLDGDLRDAGRPIRAHVLCPDAVGTEMVTTRAGQEDAAVLFSGRMLSVGAVADQAVAFLGGGPALRTLPRHRGVLIRASALSPATGRLIYRAVRAIGRRRAGARRAGETRAGERRAGETHRR
jgi:short-subunit dehydrogenase